MSNNPMSAAEVLAQHQADPSWRAGHDGWQGCTCDPDVPCDAQHQLDALKAAHVAVVELPERGAHGWPVDPDDDDFRVVPVHLVDQRTGEGLTGCRVSWGFMELNLAPVQARRLAAALLASDAVGATR